MDDEFAELYGGAPDEPAAQAPAAAAPGAWVASAAAAGTVAVPRGAAADGALNAAAAAGVPAAHHAAPAAPAAARNDDYDDLYGQVGHAAVGAAHAIVRQRASAARDAAVSQQLQLTATPLLLLRSQSHAHCCAAVWRSISR